jgi:hypothetical protein
MNDEKSEDIKDVKNGVSDGVKKKVDESWKEAVGKDKKGPSDAATGEMPEAGFGLFISGLMMEGLVALGEVENPVTKKKEANLAHAKFVVDTLAMIKEKTRNNLTGDETGTLEAILYDLRMRFVAKAGKQKD